MLATAYGNNSTLHYTAPMHISHVCVSLAMRALAKLGLSSGASLGETCPRESFTFPLCYNTSVAHACTTCCCFSIDRRYTAPPKTHISISLVLCSISQPCTICRRSHSLSFVRSDLHYPSHSLFHCTGNTNVSQICTVSRHSHSLSIASGDLHGNYRDLQFFASQFWRTGVDLCPADILFLGDYVDRGPHSVELLAYLVRFDKPSSRVFWFWFLLECAVVLLSFPVNHRCTAESPFSDSFELTFFLFLSLFGNCHSLPAFSFCLRLSALPFLFLNVSLSLSLPLASLTFIVSLCVFLPMSLFVEVSCLSIHLRSLMFL